MKYYIKEWPDNTASLYNEAGQALWTFSSIEEAMSAWFEKTSQEEIISFATNTSCTCKERFIAV